MNMRKTSWDSNNNIADQDAKNVEYVFERTNLLLLKMRLPTREFMKPPQRPRRVSSAKADTVNPPLDDANLPLDDANVECFEEDNVLNSTCSTEHIVTSESMGSSTSMHKENVPLRGTYTQCDSDLLTLSHAQVHNENELPPEEDFNNASNSVTSQSDSNTPHRSPMKAIHFKQSTFKGSQMSAVTLPRNHDTSSSLMSLFPHKGKYKFNSTDVNSDPVKSSTIRHDSAKLHQSESPDFVFKAKSPSPAVMSESEQKTAMTYGTLRKSHTTGSVSDLFTKSKLKVRKSLKNWRFVGKSEKSLDDSMTRDILVPRPELYDITVVKPEDFDNDWMSFSHDSAMIARRKQPQKQVVPVKSPVVKTSSSPPFSRSPEGNMQKVQTSHGDGTMNSAMTSLSKQENQSSSNGKPAALGHSDIDSREMLDSVLKDQSYYRHSTGTSISLGSRRMAESRASSQQDSVFFETNHTENNSNAPMTQQSTHHDTLPTPIITSSNDRMHNSNVLMTQQCNSSSESLKEFPRTISQEDSMFYTPSIKQNLIDTSVRQQSKKSKSSNAKFLTLPSPRSIHKTDSLLIRKMTGSPKMRRSHTDPERDAPISSSFENLISDKGMYSPYGSTSALSLKTTPNATPDLYSHGPPTVVPGMSVTDVLSQEYTGMKKYSSFESKQRCDDSAFSYATSEMNSYDESSNSFSESQDLVTSEGEEYEETVPSGGSTRKMGWLSLKPLLTIKRGRLERSSKRKWQKFWVTLKGDQLLFYEANEVSTTDDTRPLIHRLSLDGAIVQAMPEHATKSNVMCISLANGTVFLLQALSQMEVRNWIYGLHIEAATSLARRRCRDPTSMTKRFIRDVLEQDLEKMKTEIQEEEKMRKMAELQTSVVSDPKNQRTITEQIVKWERNAERNQVHSFRLRCYLASLETAEQPNPQPAIAAARKSSKQILSALKCFNVATLHSLVLLKETDEGTRMKRGLGVKRTGSFADVFRDGSQSDRTVPSKPKKNIFNSLRGFDSWKGSNGVRRKANQRTPITGLLTTSSSSHSSTKLSDDKSKKSFTFPLIPPPGGEYDSANDRAPDTQSEDDTLDDSLTGSLDSLLLSPLDAWVPMELESSSIRVAVAANDFVTVTLTQKMNFRQLLEIVCQRKQLASNSHYLIVGDGETEVKGDELVAQTDRKLVRIRKKRQYHIEIESRSSDFGIKFHQPKALCCPLEIESVTPGGVADTSGILAGEEILVLNGELTLDMEDDDVKQVLDTERLRLLVQTTRHDPESQLKTWWIDNNESKYESISLDSVNRGKAKINHLMAVLEEYLKNMVVPPPPVVSKLQPCFIRSPFSVMSMNSSLERKRDSIEDILSALTVPPPSGEKSDFLIRETTENGVESENCNNMIQQLLQKAEAVTKMCHLLQSFNPPSLPSDEKVEELPTQQMTNVDKIWKVLEELVETETNYVVDLDSLLHRFLEPLHAEGYLTNPAMESLLLSVRNIVNFQQAFQEELSQSFSKTMNRNDVATLNHCLLAVSTTFLQRAAQFKLYAVFCSCHTVAQDLIEQTRSPSSEVRAFLDARNPKQQHSLSLDSYLIKPIQRVLKYPLLLRELLSLSESLDVIDTKTRRRLKATLHAMHAVARHINDSQTVHDEFGMQGFQEIMEQAALMALGSMEIASSLTLTNLFCYCSAEWQNPPVDITIRKKKGNFLEMLVLVFRSSVVLLCRSTKQRKKAGMSQSDSFPSHARAVTTDFIFTDVIPRENISMEGKVPGLPAALELTSTDLDIEARTYRLVCANTESKQRVLKSVRYIVKEASRSLLLNDDSQNGTESRFSESATDVEFTARSVNSARSTPTSQHRFFYLPTKQSESDEPLPTVSKIPMTLPLPSYEVTSQTSSFVGRGVRSRKLRHTRALSANHRRSGLYITMTPQRPNENSFQQLLPDNDNDVCGKSENSNADDDDNSDSETPKIALPNAPISFEQNSSHDDQSSVSSSSDIVQTGGLSVSEPNLAHHSPARYPTAYEVSCFEGNF